MAPPTRRETKSSPEVAPRRRQSTVLKSVLVLVGAACLPGASSSSSSSILDLVDARGKLASASEITSLLSGFGGKPINVVGVLGSKGSGKSTLLNQAFGTSFPVGGPLGKEDTTGVSAAIFDGVLLLDCDGTEGGSKEATTTGQATAFSAALSDVLLMNLWRSDLGRRVASNVRTIKTFFNEKLQLQQQEQQQEVEDSDTPDDAATRTPVVVAVHDCDPGADASALETAVMEEMSAVWREVDNPSGDSLEDCFDVQVVAIPHPRYHAVAYATAIQSLKAKLQSMEASTATTGFRERVTKAWTAVRDAGATILPAKSELVSVYKVDAAFGEVMASADSQLKAWRQIVGSGKFVSDFGERSSKLFTSSLKAFDTKTVRFSTSSTRGTKRAALLSVMKDGIKELYARQLTMLCTRGEKTYKTELVKLLEADLFDEDSEANVLRKTLFAFEADATALVPSVLDLGFEDEYEELEADLQDFSEKFADSPAAQAKAIQKVDSKVKKPKGERSIGFGLGLVGMVRQEGYGNLQGFSGYRLGPHTVTFGYANDASLPDAVVNGKKPPLLRLQPKLNIDIDL